MNREVRIFQPAKTAMQSGKAKTYGWALEFKPIKAKTIEPLMGWTASGDMNRQLKLRFLTLEEAIAYAKANYYVYTVEKQTPHISRPKSYGDNFMGRLR